MDWTIKLIVVCTLTHLVSSQDANSEELSSKSVDNIARMPSHTVLMYFLEMEITECSYECVKHHQCMTINYNFKQRICELVDSTFDKYEADFETKDWINIGVPKINGNFSEWKIASGCSVTCGNGTRRLVRECDNPRPTLGGRDCEGEREKDEDCVLKECPICYESKDDKPGTIDITKSGKIKSLRLTHVSGYLDCAPTGTTDTRSFWGCGPYQRLQTVITRIDKTIIFPEDVDDHGQDEVTSPKTHKDPELRFEANRRDINVKEGEHLQVWYAEDLKNHYDNDNEGRHCIYVDVEYK